MSGDPASTASAREKLLDAALGLIAEQGLAGVSNRNLARAAGVSLGSLTYHFASQEELLAETLLRFVEREAERLSAVAAQLGEGVAPEQAAQTVQALLSRESANRLAKLELYLYAARRPALQDAARRCFAAYDAVVEAALATLGVAPTAGLAPTAVAVIDGLQIRRLAGGGADELPAADALTLLLRGAAAPGT